MKSTHKPLILAFTAISLLIMQVCSGPSKKAAKESPMTFLARYHSNSTLYKADYLEKIEVRMKLLAKDQALAMK